ncbi:hypothetical protein AKO1_000355 [Acrasis kona]|uniref:Uncharacterized protein n=1 Tax=Acrasis kona TaxID=1008807 RepID=A0AAW2ZEF7_9EUKA
MYIFINWILFCTVQKLLQHIWFISTLAAVKKYNASLRKGKLHVITNEDNSNASASSLANTSDSNRFVEPNAL